VCEISLNVQCYEKISNENMRRLNVGKIIPSNLYMISNKSKIMFEIMLIAL
jgi:hypothetical protein